MVACLFVCIGEESSVTFFSGKSTKPEPPSRPITAHHFSLELEALVCLSKMSVVPSVKTRSFHRYGLSMDVRVKTVLKKGKLIEKYFNPYTKRWVESVDMLFRLAQNDKIKPKCARDIMMEDDWLDVLVIKAMQIKEKPPRVIVACEEHVQTPWIRKKWVYQPSDLLKDIAPEAEAAPAQEMAPSPLPEKPVLEDWISYASLSSSFSTIEEFLSTSSSLTSSIENNNTIIGDLDPFWDIL